jgi:hypothetical protein
MNIEQEAIQTIENASFPIYIVPASLWRGHMYVAGTWGTTSHPLSIGLLYVDDAGAESYPRGIEVTTIGSEGLSEMPFRDPSHERSYNNQLINFVHRFTKVPQQRIPGAVRYDESRHPQPVIGHSVGPRRHLSPLKTTLRDHGVAERVAFNQFSQLRFCRIGVDPEEVVILSWAVDDEELSEFLLNLRRMTPSSGIFDEFKASEFAAWQRIVQGYDRYRCGVDWLHTVQNLGSDRNTRSRLFPWWNACRSLLKCWFELRPLRTTKSIGTNFAPNLVRARFCIPIAQKKLSGFELQESDHACCLFREGRTMIYAPISACT